MRINVTSYPEVNQIAGTRNIVGEIRQVVRECGFRNLTEARRNGYEVNYDRDHKLFVSFPVRIERSK